VEANTNEQQHKNEWWKWPLVPIASIAGACLGVAAFVLMQWVSLKFMGGSADGWLFKYIVPVMSSAVFGYAFIWCACKVAPKSKAITGIVMATLLVLIMVFGFYFAVTNSHNTYGDIILGILQGIAASCAAIAGAKEVIQEHGYNQ
jgi:hypothetical protein